MESMHGALSMRLQTENPLDEFSRAVEEKLLQELERNKTKKQYVGDKDFFRSQDDNGMCLSMHQPWAQLMVAGFKRFEGREWNTKYRGPLWVHSTSKKPDPELIKELEDAYREHYAILGEDMPDFPVNYPTSMIIGRCDLVDVLTLDEFKDTVPKILQERTVAQY